MHEQELESIVKTLHDMEGHFEKPTSAEAPYLNSIDRAKFKRLMLEVKGILGAGLGLNDFGGQLFLMTNLRGYGVLNPPTLEQLHEAVGLVEGGLNQLLRKSSLPPNTNGATHVECNPKLTPLMEYFQSKFDPC